MDLVAYTKYNLLSHPFSLYDWGWDVDYWLSDNSDFGVNIDPYAGRYINHERESHRRNAAEQSVHWTLGILRDLQAFF